VPRTPHIYFDTSALLRLFDAAPLPRVRRERSEVLRLLAAVRTGRCTAAWSRAHQLELVAQGPYQREIIDELRRSFRAIRRSKIVPPAARAYAAAGLRGLDAVHLAYAVAAGARVLVTTDDGFRRAASRLPGLPVEVLSPTATIVRLGMR